MNARNPRGPVGLKDGSRVPFVPLKERIAYGIPPEPIWVGIRRSAMPRRVLAFIKCQDWEKHPNGKRRARRAARRKARAA